MTSRKWTPADFQAWLDKHTDPLKEKQDQRRKEIQHGVIDYVRCAMRDWRMSRNAAGDDLLRRFPYGPSGSFTSTPPETEAALLAIGWVPKRKRGKGGAE